MPPFNTALQRAHLDDVTPDVHGRISKRTAELDGVSVTEVTFGVGTRWSEDLKEYAGTTSCELPHVALVVRGTLRVVLEDGSSEDFSDGDVMLLPPATTPGPSETSRPASSSSRAATTTTRAEPPHEARRDRPRAPTASPRGRTAAATA